MTGVVALSMGVQPSVYDAHTPAGETTCKGIQCFRLFHVVCFVANGAGTFGIAILLRSFGKHRAKQQRALVDVSNDI